MQVLFPELLTSLHQQLNDFTLLSFCHNYYPRPDTGLSVDLVNKKNELIYQFNPKAQIYGFIVGSDLRGPLQRLCQQLKQRDIVILSLQPNYYKKLVYLKCY